MTASELTIVAPATSSPSLRSLIRISGTQVYDISNKLGINKKSKRSFQKIKIELDNLYLRILAITYEANNTLTGEPVLELIIPGSEIVVRKVIDLLLDNKNIVKALPGEFSRRSLENNKMTLNEATSIAHFTAATGRSEYMTLNATKKMLGNKLREIQDELISVGSAIEANCDFADEDDVTFINQNQVIKKLTKINKKIQTLLHRPFKSTSYNTPIFIFQGLPSSGKSTLFNALLKTERVVTSPEKGTTKDNISADWNLSNGQKITIQDTPGTNLQNLETEHRPEIGKFYLSCHVSNAVGTPPPKTLCLSTMIDLAPAAEWSDIGICAPLNLGLEELENKIIEILYNLPTVDSIETVESEALHLASKIITESIKQSENVVFQEEIIADYIQRTYEVLAFDQKEKPSEILLDNIFAKFCIGK